VFTALSLVWALGCAAPAQEVPEVTDLGNAAVRPGIEVLLTDSLGLVRGRRVGLVTNQTGIDGSGRSSIDRLADHAEVELVALFTPEHGIRGEAQDGVLVESSVDARTGLPIHSLYGDTRIPTPAMLEGVELLLFDIQDIGARYYTYVSTMAVSMEAAGRAEIPFVVLDRPNPIRGDVVQGNVLDPAFATFVGKYPVPMRHGMTPGELARMYVGEFGISVDLTVIPLGGWARTMVFEDTGLPWVPPSPNMPDVESALVYPGTCLFEGTALSVGRGTARPFQWVGASWLDGAALADALNAYGIEEVLFEAVRFTPDGASDGKFEGEEIEGVRVVSSSTAFDAPRVALAMLVETHRASGENWTWNVANFDRLSGTDALRLGIEAGLDAEALASTWDPSLRDFVALREPYLLYR
jgi:uncharacterized protein YbbC (DUF1343 family)